MPETFKIGRLGKTHGVKGELTFHFTDDVFDRVEADYVFVETEGLLVPFFFEEYRFRNEETALVKFEGIDDATRAAQLTGCDVYFPRELADSDDGELTWTEIVGFTIADSVSGQTVGEVTGVDLSTINTLFEVLTPDGQTVLIPANDELIDDINRQQRCITMRIPEGLLEV
ncbi:MAG: 16S rRNA processing protein RimM [Prevotella sp.]|nr:16S rRNA processing protein RimM [Prevotella sp.]